MQKVKMKKAVVENKRTVLKLEYGNDPDNITMTTPSEVTTPTYPLDIKKQIRNLHCWQVQSSAYIKMKWTQKQLMTMQLR